MIRTILIIIVLFALTFFLSESFWGYDRAGAYYIGEQREQRKSVRQGSHGGFFYYGHGGSGGLRGGK
jgi:hypothetical protein